MWLGPKLRAAASPCPALTRIEWLRPPICPQRVWRASGGAHRIDLMRVRPTTAELLITLAQQADPDERHARFRQVIVALSQSSGRSPPPLESVNSHLLETACRLALDSGFADDLDWIESGGAGVALYELMMALPHGQVRRDYGRRVFSRLYGGPAGAFAQVAARMAWGSVKQLQSATLRARVRLCFSLPIGSGVNVGPLALALVSRDFHFTEWVARESYGALHPRQLAAQILEQAAREAVLRAQQGDPYPLELMCSGQRLNTLHRLLADKEPLVWRHAASARGLLATRDNKQREEIELALDPALTPTEWRRSVVSLVAGLTVDPEWMPQCRAVLNGPLGQRHPGIYTTFVWGLPRVVESEPELAEELLLQLAAIPNRATQAALVKLLREVSNPAFGEAAAVQSARTLAQLEPQSDPLVMICALQLRERSATPSGRQSVYDATRRALAAYETSGAATAQELAVEALALAEEATKRLLDNAYDPAGLDLALPTLIDLDESTLEQARLYDLLLLGRRPGDPDASAPRLDTLYRQLTTWLQEGEEHQDLHQDWTPRVLRARQQALVALLHLLDVQTTQPSQEQQAEKLRGLLRSALQTLVRSLSAPPPSPLRRVVCATLARCFDAAVREGVSDVGDLLLLTLERVSEQDSVLALADASTHHAMRTALRGYLAFLTADEEEEAPSPARRFEALSRAVGVDATARGEALRQALHRIGRELSTIGEARGLSELVATEAGGSNALEELERHLSDVVRLTDGSRNRLLPRGQTLRPSAPGSHPPVSAVVEQALRRKHKPDENALEGAMNGLLAALPASLRPPLKLGLRRLVALPIEAPATRALAPLKPPRAALPDWLLPRRTIGAFYVLRPIGSGGVSSVFLARRLEERRDDAAEAFALKVPEFDPSTARSLSEQQFMDMFRDEAGALLALPKHPNLARFVNFDLAARPKPILVMEMIFGDSLEKLIRSRSLSLAPVFDYMRGILDGLAAMHAVGVAHLDIKPSNVILRDGKTPVLVDFGLSGRALRPGCGTPEYCAPEVLGVVPDGHEAQARPADIYAFACMAMQLLTGQLLFDADNETALIARQVAHDGWPEPLSNFATHPGLRELAVIFAACLRRDPRLRPTVTAVRSELERCRPQVLQHTWPLPLHGRRVQATG